MRGEILTYDPQTGAGLVSGDDLQRYSFRSHLSGLAVGRRIDFVIDGLEAREPVLLPPGPVAQRFVSKPVVSKPVVSKDAPIAVSAAITPRDWKSRLFSLSGRMERAYFWKATLIMTSIHAIAWGVAILFPQVRQVIPITFLACLWPYLAITTKRLHDIGRTGWLVAIPLGLIVLVLKVALFIAVLGGLYGILAISIDTGPSTQAFQGVAMVAIGAVLLILLVHLAFVILIGCRKGQPHNNRFGAPPTGTAPIAI